MLRKLQARLQTTPITMICLKVITLTMVKEVTFCLLFINESAGLSSYSVYSLCQRD